MRFPSSTEQNSKGERSTLVKPGREARGPDSHGVRACPGTSGRTFRLREAGSRRTAEAGAAYVLGSVASKRVPAELLLRLCSLRPGPARFCRWLGRRQIGRFQLDHARHELSPTVRVEIDRGVLVIDLADRSRPVHVVTDPLIDCKCSRILCQDVLRSETQGEARIQLVL